MNSLNLLSSRVIGQTSSERPSNYRRRSFSDGILGKVSEAPLPRRSTSQHVKRESSTETLREKDTPDSDVEIEKSSGVATPLTEPEMDEKVPLLGHSNPPFIRNSICSNLRVVARRLLTALGNSVQILISTLTAPGLYIVACLYDDAGSFSPFHPLRKLSRRFPTRSGSSSTAQAIGLSGSPNHSGNMPAPTDATGGNRRITKARLRRAQGSEANFSASSESDPDVGKIRRSDESAPDSRVKTRASSSSDDSTSARRSIRIKLYNDDTARRRKPKRPQGRPGSNEPTLHSNDQEPPLTVATIKSPTSPTSSLRMTKYPRAPAPPRPLIPQRQPSYSTSNPARRSSSQLAQKTLVIDLDETLIHSLAKGGRMSSGHMVEVKLNASVGYGGTTIGPQHPILYYVHKRPHCDEFLRKVCKWYNLVIFTASVQEYADPVIDWLEQERKYFTKRYYRQHCTFRNGAYIKDLSAVEPDLSRVMILDNSPLSYVFHEGKCLIQFSVSLLSF